MNFYFFIIMMVNKSGQAAAISSASGVNGLSSCSRGKGELNTVNGLSSCSRGKGALNTIKLRGQLKGALIRGEGAYSRGRALNQAITVISFLGP